MSDQLNSAWQRLRAQTPAFFKKIRRIGNSLSAAGLACTAANIAPQVHMPPTLAALGVNAIVAGFIMTTVASFACQDPNDIKPKD